jgi:hypothetical protein
MAGMLEAWARAQRQAIREDIRWLNAGAKTISPSGDGITAMKLEQLNAQLEGVNLALQEVEDAPRT